MNISGQNKTSVRLNSVLLLLPCWLLLFFYKEKISHFLVYKILMMAAGTRLSATLSFFFTTFLKISLLLVFIVFVMGMVRTFFPVQRVKKRLMDMPQIPATVMSALFGVLTPFCSCSAVPMFISFLETGVPLGLTFSFLIASPLVNEVIVVMLAGLFGFKVALIYALAGLLIASSAGYLIGRLNLEKYLPDWMLNFRNEKEQPLRGSLMENMLSSGFLAVNDVISRTWIFILAGVIIGAAIHGYVPEGWLNKVLAGNAWYSLPLVVLTGIPLYSCSASVAPVAFALVDKGMPLGSALAFIMAVAGLSLPEFIMLKKVLSVRLIAIFAGIVFTGILLMGYIFNLLL